MAEKNKTSLFESEIIVAKFGGSSLSNGEHFQKVKEIEKTTTAILRQNKILDRVLEINISDDIYNELEKIIGE